MNKHISSIKFFTYLLIFSPLVLFLSSCGGSSPCPETECDCAPEVCEMCYDQIAQMDEDFCNEYLFESKGYHKLIDGYHKASHISGSASTVTEDIDLYLDFSDGMNNKISQAEAEAGLLTDLVNILAGEKVDYFRLKTEKGKEIENITNSVRNIESFVRDAKNYNSDYNYAPLDVAVNTMVGKHDRQSIFITDGELARKDLSPSVDPTYSWAKEAFTNWLEEGNRLDFVSKEIGTERLFFIFFTPRLLAESDKNMINVFLEATDDVNKSDKYQHLKFTLNDYSLEKIEEGSRPDKEKGLNTTFVDWVMNYSIKNEANVGYEHIHIEEEEGFKKYLAEFEEGLYDEDYEKSLEERNKLFYNLVFTNEFINYQIADLEVKVEDFSGPLNEYMEYLKCTQATSITFEDEEGAKTTYWCNPANGCNDNSQCEYKGVGKKGRALKQVFDLHEESTISVDEKNQFSTAKIAIKPAESFDIDEMYEMSHTKIELYIKDVEFDEGGSRQDLSVLTWKYKGKDNTGLKESVRLAMRQLKPQNKLIYTYYITFGFPY